MIAATEPSLPVRPKRGYRRWGEAETFTFVHLFDAGFTDEQMAAALGRSVRSVRARLRTLRMHRGAEHCRFCGAVLDEIAGRSGRKRLYCDRACRRRHHYAYEANARRGRRAP